MLSFNETKYIKPVGFCKDGFIYIFDDYQYSSVKLKGIKFASCYDIFDFLCEKKKEEKHDKEKCNEEKILIDFSKYYLKNFADDVIENFIKERRNIKE